MYITIRKATFPRNLDSWSGSLPNAVLDSYGRPHIHRIEPMDGGNTEMAWVDVWYEAYS